MNSLFNWIVIAFLVWRTTEGRTERSVIALTKCVRMAEPLIHDPQYIFPLSVLEIKNVCEMWDGFVNCVRKYTSTYLTLDQQTEFEKAIKPSMESIHQLCIEDEQYQKAYLNYAPCMKMVATQREYCGSHYEMLAQIAESSSETGPAICCGYHKFRSCALQEAAKECDRGIIQPTSGTEGAGDSSHFVSSMLNRALGFLLQKCSKYESTTEACSTRFPVNKDLHSYSVVAHNFGEDSSLNVANLFPMPNEQSTQSSVTIKPRPFDNSFTWKPIPQGSFYPTDLDNHIREPKSEEFRGRGTAASLQVSVVLLSVLSAVLSILI